MWVTGEDENILEYKEIEGANLALSSADQDRTKQAAIAGFPRPPGLESSGYHGDDAEVWIPSLEYLFQYAEKKFRGLMKRLLDDFEQLVDKNNLEYDSDIGVHRTNDENDNAINKDRIGRSNSSKGKAKETAPKARRSLLKAFTGRLKLWTIMDYVNKRPLKNYTQKVSSLFLQHFKYNKRSAKAQFGSHDTKHVCLESHDTNENDANEFNYIRLGSENSDKTIKGEPAPDLNRTESLLNKKYALQLALLFNELGGSKFSKSFRNREKMDAIELLADDAYDESEVVRLFASTRGLFNDLFDFMAAFDTGITVTADKEGSLPTGGHADLVVIVSGENVSGEECKKVSEFPVIIEFKKPNAGFWIGWTLLTGQEWTNEELNAFFKLKAVKATDGGNEWEMHTWPEMTNLANLVGSKRVDVKYSVSTDEPAATSTATSAAKKRETTAATPAAKRRKNAAATPAAKRRKNAAGKPIATAAAAEDPVATATGADESAATATAARAPKLTPSYFIRDGDQMRDITRELEKAKVKICADNSLKTLSQVTHYATGSNCDIIAIADGLTFIVGSVYKVVREPKGDSNPDDSDHVLTAIFDSTAMIQTHDRDSTLHVLNLLCNSTATSRVRCAWYRFLMVAGEVYGDDIRITTEKQAALKTRLRELGEMRFNAQDHCKPIPGIRESGKLQSKPRQKAIVQTLADTNLPGVPLCVTSSYFAIREWFRETVYEGYEFAGSSSPLGPGRSKSVARVQLRVGTNRKNYVLKEYFGDKYSIARWRLELDAYSRIDKLGPNDKKHVAKLVKFGSLDLDEPNPRLFLLLEYVEEPEYVPAEEAILVQELRKVYDLLASVGVYHNDLEDRNYKWQRDTDGIWYIKVFDFDHATIRGL